MVLAFAGAGFYFGQSSRTVHPQAEPAACRSPMTTLTNASPPAGRSPTTSTSESSVPLASKSMPWETNATQGKYQYYPGGDSSAAPKDAPSAINTVVVPDVELPKVRASALCGLPLWLGKLTHHCRDSTTSTTSGARTATRHDSHLETAAYTEKEWSCLALLSMWAGVSCKLDRLRVTLRVEGDLNRACMNFGMPSSLLCTLAQRVSVKRCSRSGDCAPCSPIPASPPDVVLCRLHHAQTTGLMSWLLACLLATMFRSSSQFTKLVAKPLLQPQERDSRLYGQIPATI
jgi:hypothetical protein